MSHHLDFDSILEECFLLEHLINGSKKYCADRKVGSDEDQGDAEFDEYWGWTKSIVSRYLLNCSIKIRVILDVIKNKEDIIDLNLIDSNACQGLILGEITEGNFNLNLRETCNKIIHAQKVVLQWTEINSDANFKYWNGKYELHGARNNEKWTLILDVNNWAKATVRFITQLNGTDANHYFGQDWY